jgi:hypothetical protein
VGQELRLNEFKELYRQLKTGVPWLDFLILGGLVWLEDKYIQIRVESTVDQALEEVKLPPMPDYVSPVITEKPSETSTSLPELRITTPWYKETNNTIERP